MSLAWRTVLKTFKSPEKFINSDERMSLKSFHEEKAIYSGKV